MKKIDYGMLPYHMQEGMRNYIEHGILPGGFLTAVLENDLMGAISKADDFNKRRLHDYGMFLYNEVPASCFGSPEAVQKWIASFGKEQE